MGLPFKEQFTVAPSAARTETFTSDEFTALHHLGVRVTLVATALEDDPSVVMEIQGFNDTAGTWYTVLTDAAVTTASPTTSHLIVHPRATATANVSAPDYLPRTWRVVVTHADADPITYSINAELLP